MALVIIILVGLVEFELDFVYIKSEMPIKRLYLDIIV